MQEQTQKQIFFATGRRKESSARVQLISPGEGKILINKRDYLKYFPTVDQQIQIKKPLTISNLEKNFDILANVSGGGLTGQAGAVSLGIARALVQYNPDLKTPLKKENLLTRDPRSKERKKYGRKGARRRFQWTKR